jgi:hypothetical protein
MAKKPLGDVVSDLFASLSSLVRTETELAQAEFRETIDTGVRNAVTAVVGAIIVLPAAVIILEGIAIVLIRAGVGDYAAYLIIGGIAAAVGVIVMMTAMKKLKKMSLLPKRTIHQFQRDVEVAKYARQNYETERAA